MTNGPKKYDSGKLRLELIPPEFIHATARGLGYGAQKYSAGNWAVGQGFEWSRLYGALQRHLVAFWSGEDLDAESGNCHLDHAACMLAFLIAHRERRLGKDDRVDVGVKPATGGFVGEPSLPPIEPRETIRMVHRDIRSGSAS